MTGRGLRPPTASRRLLAWAAQRLEAPDLADDAAELFLERARKGGVRRARAWYRRQARAALGRALFSPGRRRAARTKVPESRSRNRRWASGAWAGLSIDARLGARMLVKHPGVTVVGGLAMTIGIGLGAAYLEVVRDFLHPTLPVDEGERIVGIQNFDAAANEPELRSLHDFLAWREDLRTVRELGAYRAVEWNLGPADGTAEPAEGAAITASGLRLTRVPALLGRTLADADEREGAAAVVVLGYDVWRSRFFGDPAVVGRTVRLGGSTGTVVGVMPEGFAFPLSHRFWVPLPAEASVTGPRQGPSVQIFGRLAPGASLEAAQAELTARGLRAATDQPDTHALLRPRIMPYPELFVGGEGAAQAYLVESLFVMLLLVLGSNVATMVFARTAMRENEIAMRFALGAGRAQILVQFFVEALVLALAATALALVVVASGTGWVTRFAWRVVDGRVPFWLDGRMNVSTVVCALALALLGALVAGVLPALKATGSGLRARLRHAPGAAGSAMRFGGLWSGLIVLQVAFAVLALPPAVVAVSTLGDAPRAESGFVEDEYLSARVELELVEASTDTVARAARFAEFQAAYEELRRRMLADPSISGVAVANRLPGMDHQQPVVEVDGEEGGPPVSEGRWVMTAAVEPAFFDVFGAEIVAGRDFDAADVEADVLPVVVNEHFVTEILDGRNAVGRRVRPVRPEPGPWHEIVGVVSNLGMDTDRDPFHPGKGPGMYQPLTPDAMEAGGAYSVRLAFHVHGDPSALGPRLREVAQAVSPDLRLHDVLLLDGPVDRANRMQRLITSFFASVTGLVGFIALLISIAGTYSVMSFTVSRQTREIGIRIALGAGRRRIVTQIFSRAMLQIGAGIAAGTAVWFYLIVFGLGGEDRLDLLLINAAVLVLVGLLACGVPVRRALRIEPTEALREAG